MSFLEPEVVKVLAFFILLCLLVCSFQGEKHPRNWRTLQRRFRRDLHHPYSFGKFLIRH